jgi:hypothetical protein
MKWEATSDQNWLYASPKSGTLAPGASLDVNARISSAEANARLVGTHEATLSFTNLSSGSGNTTRRAKLVVERPTFNITLQLQPAGAGAVSGAGTFRNGEKRTVTATANTGWIFDKWTDQGGATVSENASFTFTLSKDTTLRANFVVPFRIDLSASPSDTGTVSGGGFVKPGGQVTIRAAANPGFQFEKWTENGAFVSAKLVYKFIANADRTLVAQFRPTPNDLAVRYSAATEADYGGIFGHLNGQPPELGGEGTAQNLVNWRTRQMAVGQLDDDEYDEVVWLEFGAAGGLYRTETVPLQTFERNSLNNPRPVTGFAVGDFDGDGRDDVFARVSGSGSPYMKLVNGTWTDVTLPSLPLLDHMFTADVDGNGKDDILGYGPSTTGLGMIHDGGTSSRNIYGGTVLAADAGDLDANGQVDIAFAVDNQVLIQKNGLEIVGSPTSFGSAKQLHFADADGDGKDELYKLKDDGVWRMNSDRTWTQIMQSDSPNSITVLGSADFDSNGKQDLIVQQTRPGEHFFVLMNNAAEFTWYWWGQVNSNAIPIGFAAGVFD